MKKIMYYLFLILVTVSASQITAQVGVNESSNSPDPSAMLDIESSDKGLLIPRLTEAARDAIAMPAPSLLIFQTDQDIGYYYNQGTMALPEWVKLSTVDDAAQGSRIPIDTLPYVIDQAGSYYIAAAIAPLSGSDGITINASHVSIDLNGYTLTGSGSGAYSGIKTTSLVNHITIYNGHLTAWSGSNIDLFPASYVHLSHVHSSASLQSGVVLGYHATVSYVSATDNAADGIFLRNNAIVTHCQAANNGFDGIDTWDESNISYCSVANNGDNGVEVDAGSTLSTISSHDNGANGFMSGNSTTIEHCIAKNNAEDGFETGNNTVLRQNAASGNLSNGMVVNNNSVLEYNRADDNGGFGYEVTGSGSRLDQNQASSNTSFNFNIAGSDNLVLRCSSQGGTGFNIGAGNANAPILNAATLLSNDNPYANISL